MSKPRIVPTLALVATLAALALATSPSHARPVRCDKQHPLACRQAVHRLQRAVAWQRHQVWEARRAARVAPASKLTPIEVGRALAARRAWTGAQFACLITLWSRESGWVPTKQNYAGSGAYGIPQALPGSKMASAGPDWRTNAATQILWGLGYVDARYGSPCGALAWSNAYGYY